MSSAPSEIFDGWRQRKAKSPPRRPLASKPSPKELGFRMPGEFEPQDRVWMAWPGATTRAWADVEALFPEMASLASAIRRYQPVSIVADPAFADEARAHLGPSIDVVPLVNDDIWMRDTGPSFVLDSKGRLGAVSWSFNTWGDKFDGHERDATLAGRLADHLAVDGFVAGIIAEGGGLHVDGDGTAVLTESSIINDNRNPGMSKADIEAHLNAALGTEKIIWLPGPGGDSITDGHIDGIMTFVKPGVALFEVTDDPNHPKFEALKEKKRAFELATDARGRRIEFAVLKRPKKVRSAEKGFCDIYVNCLVVNGAVIMPRFGDDAADAEAQAIFRRAFPGRDIVALDIDSIAEGGGGIHCITQQQPARRQAT
jgi:agmatine deiminase